MGSFRRFRALRFYGQTAGLRKRRAFPKNITRLPCPCRIRTAERRSTLPDKEKERIRGLQTIFPAGASDLSRKHKLRKTAGAPPRGCSDTIVSCREGDGCRITLNRRVSFEPEHLFYLSVSVGTRFRFDMRYYEEVDWSREDVAGAFRESNSPALTDMMARCSLLIAQITSATGHTPFVTPATPEDAAAKSGNP